MKLNLSELLKTFQTSVQRLICQKSSHTHTHTVFWKTKPELIFFLSLPLCWDRPKSCSRLDNKHQMISHGTVIRSLRLLLVSVSNFYPDYKRPIRLFVSVQVSKATLTYTASTNQTPSPLTPPSLPPVVCQPTAAGSAFTRLQREKKIRSDFCLTGTDSWHAGIQFLRKNKTNLGSADRRTLRPTHRTSSPVSACTAANHITKKIDLLDECLLRLRRSISTNYYR